MRNFNCKLVPISLLVFLAITSCKEPEIAQVDNSGDFHQVEQSYLEKHNNQFTVYRSTKTYLKIKSDSMRVPFEVMNRYDLLEFYFDGRKEDSLTFQLEDDTLRLSYFLPFTGSCLEFEPYLYGANGRFILKSPEVVDGAIEIENGDTLIYHTSGCALETVAEIKYKVPLSLIGKDWSLLIFRNKRIIPEDLN